MVLRRLSQYLVGRAERRIGVQLDYARQIARTDTGLFLRYGRIFGFLDPNRKAPAAAYHAARLRGAIAADCGTCVEAEMNLAATAGLSAAVIDRILAADYTDLPEGVAAAARLADAVTARHADDPEARETIRRAYGDAGLIEISYAMTGAALPPGIKRAMGHATACDLALLRRTRAAARG